VGSSSSASGFDPQVTFPLLLLDQLSVVTIDHDQTALTYGEGKMYKSKSHYNNKQGFGVKLSFEDNIIISGQQT